MTTKLTQRETAELNLPALSREDGQAEPRVHAICFDLNQEALRDAYPNDSYLNAYQQIGNFLAKRGFTRQQGSVYFGDRTVTPVTTVLAVQELARAYPWFNSSVVTDIRMLRIEEDNDLNPAIASVVAHGTQDRLDLGDS